jgi:hypothetical protein
MADWYAVGAKGILRRAIIVKAQGALGSAVDFDDEISLATGGGAGGVRAHPRDLRVEVHAGGRDVPVTRRI